MELQSLIDQPHKLPTVPAVTMKLIASFSDENVAFRQISEQISADPALSAKLLRLANSAYFHLSRTIGTVEDALHMLGFVMVRNLVLGNGMAVAFRNTQGMDLQQFWRFNLLAASAARWMATKAGLNSDLVFTVGLMHGIGQLQMHVAAPQAVLPLDKLVPVLDGGRAALEKETLGFHNGDVAAELARIWNFPAPIVLALRWVPEPLGAPEFSDAAACVHLGTWVARQALQPTSPEQMQASFPALVAQPLGLSWQQIDQELPPAAELTLGLDSLLD
jgi:HD-like signal output (HDOD) protein